MQDRILPMNVYLYQYILATGVVALQAILAVIIILMILKKDTFLRKHFQKHGMKYALVAVIAALIGSLGFSEIYAYEPCKLCWVQRIFHYPQLILFVIALKYKDTRVWTYSIWLSVIGIVIGGYQVIMQFFPSFAPIEVCSIVPAAADCSDILIQAFGYVSIPVMSVTLYAALIVLFILQKNRT